MRSKLAIINMACAIANQLILVIINFILRKVFINSIGIEYLGVNGLFSNVLALLGLVESGFGIAMVYNLYKPIADSDEKRISALMNYYAKVYKVIAFLVLGIGLCIAPFLKIFIKECSFSTSQLYIFYILFVINNVASYFLAYKISFLTACQKNYYVVVVNTVITFIFAVLKISSLLIWKSYVIYLILIIVNTILSNICISILTTKLYPYLRDTNEDRLDGETSREIKKNVKALFLHKMGSFVLTGTDNIVISIFIGLSAVGIYSNYTMIIGAINQIVNQLFNAITPTIGNLMASEDDDKIYQVFHLSYYLSFLIYTFCSIMLYVLINPFIEIWLGKSFLLDEVIMTVIIANFYFTGMRNVVSATKNAAGVFFQDRFAPMCESILNLIISIGSVKYLGVLGVFLGTLISGLLVPFWVGPKFLYRDVFHRSLVEFLKLTLRYFILSLIGAVAINVLLNDIFSKISFFSFILRMMSAAILAILYIASVLIISPEKKRVLHYINIVIKRKKTIKVIA